MAGIASVLGVVVGFLLGGIGVATSSCGYELTFAQGVVLTLVTVIWLVVTAFAIAREEPDSL